MTSKISTAFGLLTAFLFVGMSSFGQTVAKTDLTSEWQIIAQQDGVNIFVKEAHCDMNNNGKPIVFSMIKLENTTNEKKSITYNYIHQYDQGCDGCGEGSEKIYTINLEGNSQMEDDCSIKFNGLSSIIKSPYITTSWKFESVSINILSVN